MLDSVQSLGVIVLRIGSSSPPTETEILTAIDRVMARYQVLHPEDADSLRAALDVLLMGMRNPDPEIADAALAAFAGVFTDIRIRTPGKTGETRLTP